MYYHETGTRYRRFFLFFPYPPLSWRYVPGGVIVYWKELEKFLPRHGKPSAKILWLSVLRQRSRTIWSTTMDVIEQSSKTFFTPRRDRYCRRSQERGHSVWMHRRGRQMMKPA